MTSLFATASYPLRPQNIGCQSWLSLKRGRNLKNQLSMWNCDCYLSFDSAKTQRSISGNPFWIKYNSNPCIRFQIFTHNPHSFMFSPCRHITSTQLTPDTRLHPNMRSTYLTRLQRPQRFWKWNGNTIGLYR